MACAAVAWRGWAGTADGEFQNRRHALQALLPKCQLLAPGRYELRADARRFETWENNYAARLGLGVAVDYARAIGIEAIAARARSLADHLRTELRKIAGVTIHDLGPHPAAIVSFTVKGHEAQAVKLYLAEARINVGTSSPSSTLLDATARKLPPLVRASPHYYNTEDEIDHLARAVHALAGHG